MGEQDLGNVVSGFVKAVFIRVNQMTLSGRRRGLLQRDGVRIGRESEFLNACDNGPRGHEDDLSSVAFDLSDVVGKALNVVKPQSSRSRGQNAAPDFNHQARCVGEDEFSHAALIS